MKIATIVLLLMSIVTRGQEEIQIIDSVKFNNSNASKIYLFKEIPEVEQLAEKDIRNENLFLFVPGGVAPSINSLDFNFMKNFNVSFINLGCSIIDLKLISSYNRQIFLFLSMKYGDKWLDKVRVDVIGLDEYRNNK